MANTKASTRKQTKRTKAVATTGAAAFHLSSPDGEHHAIAIGIWNLHVLLAQDGEFWVAQSVEIDYVVQGNSIEEAKKNFENGLEATIDLNLRMYGNIEGLLMSRNEVLQEAARNKRSLKLYWQVTMHDMGVKSKQALPFDGISFLVAKESTQEAA
jgi:predicted RNase H-like HicB family nuclease